MPLITVRVVEKPVLVEKLRKKLPKNIAQGLLNAAVHLEGVIKRDYLSGQYLNVGASTNTHIGGTLRQSITHSDVQRKGKMMFIEVGTKVVYARIHELGGVTGRNHSVHLPARHYMRDALIRERKNITRLLHGQLARAMR